ncbi:hypothetical protein AMECASPLE_010967 [Ameca splendens]|uniref:Uncharacterized protein n=1 Tax=Ameca splendens TaxID=208324 RepID=A0ABV0XPL5_9TELE
MLWALFSIKCRQNVARLNGTMNSLQCKDFANRNLVASPRKLRMSPSAGEPVQNIWPKQLRNGSPDTKSTLIHIPHYFRFSGVMVLLYEAINLLRCISRNLVISIIRVYTIIEGWL